MKQKAEQFSELFTKARTFSSQLVARPGVVKAKVCSSVYPRGEIHVPTSGPGWADARYCTGEIKSINQSTLFKTR